MPAHVETHVIGFIIIFQNSVVGIILQDDTAPPKYHSQAKSPLPSMDTSLQVVGWVPGMGSMSPIDNVLGCPPVLVGKA